MLAHVDPIATRTDAGLDLRCCVGTQHPLVALIAAPQEIQCSESGDGCTEGLAQISDVHLCEQIAHGIWDRSAGQDHPVVEVSDNLSQGLRSFRTPVLKLR